MHRPGAAFQIADAAPQAGSGTKHRFLLHDPRPVTTRPPAVRISVRWPAITGGQEFDAAPVPDWPARLAAAARPRSGPGRARPPVPEEGAAVGPEVNPGHGSAR
ncbi:hypothetical protein GCM10011594_05850 [Nakamurella endophytica]|uniref:Uncharacterized protein n=1 Tax=Nakamurella endophytica TaxID=1748367 RepID=A0A917SNX8_9ACTN|nr:hypothetical protein GCM10011594_05850 [Nakamurella endophytica]